MPGLYLHIPFCKKACHYCNFHFSTSLKLKDEMLAAILREIELQKNFLVDKELKSIYLGGGTPSLLSERELDLLFNLIHKQYKVDSGAEITLEANPDDLDLEKVKTLAASPVNRLSIGIQSFSEKDLQYMNRAHTSTEAIRSLELSLEQGFEQISVDLIYGSPTTSHSQWENNLETLFAYPIPHLSAYCLTVEEGTALHHFVKKGTARPVDEDQAARQFEVLIDRSRESGFDHYEISNFARDQKYAVHNTAYWKGEPYLGVGPSAHSFNGTARRWNVANNAKYIKALHEGIIPFEEEILSKTQQFNELVLTGLRTKWGVNLQKLQDAIPGGLEYLEKEAARFVEDGLIHREEGHLRLSGKGKLLADHIASSLFWIE